MSQEPLHLLLNIGNTHVQIAADEPDGPRLLDVCDTADARALGTIPFLARLTMPWHATAVSVVPALQHALQQTFPHLRFLSHKDFSSLDFSRVDTSTLGMDRIANAAAAFDFAKGAAVVIDFGTCIHTVIVDATGCFLGGAILPGRMLLRKSLATYTAQLPLLPLRDEVPPPCGPNTLEAIAAGVDLGVVGAVRELLAQTRRVLGESCRVFPAGGDAPFFLKALPELQPGPDLLTLRGVAVVAHAP
ncbi:MAG: type III pantothenate kinase [Victivallales bacterium]|nr:type III pantothenate kinase [Victivallales bacterium]